MNSIWTDEHDEGLQKLYSLGYYQREIADMMNFSCQSVKGRIKILSLKRDNPLLKPLERCAR